MYILKFPVIQTFSRFSRVNEKSCYIVTSDVFVCKLTLNSICSLEVSVDVFLTSLLDWKSSSKCSLSYNYQYILTHSINHFHDPEICVPSYFGIYWNYYRYLGYSICILKI